MTDYDRFLGISASRMNCFQLVRRVSSELFGVELPETPNLGAVDSMRRVELADAQPGDIVLFAPRDHGEEAIYPTHVGIVVEAGRVLHLRGNRSRTVQMSKTTSTIHSIFRPSKEPAE